MKVTVEKMEFSKKILIVAAVVFIAVIIFTCFMVYITQNLIPLEILITTIGAEVGAGTGFYYWKAKAENTIKLQKKGYKEEE